MDVRALLAPLAQLPPDSGPDTLAELERMRALLLASLLRHANDRTPVSPCDVDDRMLTADEAAPILGVAPKWLYRNAPRLPFARRLSPKAIRFSEAGLHRWLAARRTGGR